MAGPALDDLPPLHGGIMGYLGYDVVREVEHLPDVPPDDQGHPDAMVSVIGQLAAYDHWRQRATLIENVLVEPGLADDELDRRYDAASCASTSSPPTAPARSTSRSSIRPTPTIRCPTSDR